MTSQQVKDILDEWSHVVVDRPFSSTNQEHKIAGFGVKIIGPNQFELYVLAINHAEEKPIFDVPFNNWKEINGY